MEPLPHGTSAENAESLRQRLEEYRRWVQLLDSQVRLLERERQKLAAVVSHGDLGFLVIDPSLRVSWSNETFAHQLPGDDPARRPDGSSCATVLCRSERTCAGCPAAAAFATKGPAHHELSLVVDGRPRVIYATAIPILSPQGGVEQTLVMVQDMSDLEVLRHSEQKIRESESRLRMLVEQMPAVMWSTDRDLRFLSSEGSALQYLGLAPGEIVGKTLYEFFGTDDRDFLPIARHLRALAGESVAYVQDWQGRVYESYVEPMYDKNRAIVGCVGLALDVTERHRAEIAGKQSEAREHAILETALDAIVSVDEASRIVEFNPAAEQMFGYTREEALGKELAALLIPGHLRDSHRQGFQRYMTTGESRVVGHRVETTAMRKDGTEFPVELAITRVPLDGPIRFTGFIRDLTDRKKTEAALREREEQLRQSQKMEAIGTLAGGVAHDFNNILTAIVGYAGLLQRNAPSPDGVRKAAEVMEKAARRGASLTQQLLGFARKGKNQSIPVDLAATVEEVIGLLQRTIEKDITIHRAYGVPRAVVVGDPDQIQQVVLNLAVNARDAMPHGGELTVEISAVDLSEADCQCQPGTKPGPYIRLALTDSGCGIPPEVLGRIFEPFFTTKELGKGTGMGLAMVYGIVQNHGGAIGVRSVVGMGTTVEVHLPTGPDLPMLESAPAAGEARAGSGRILVVDDEESVREVAVDVLRNLGYDVVPAASGAEAVRYFADAHAVVDAVLLDLAMPDMGGRECFHALKEIDPDVRAVLCTGYGFNVATQQLVDEGMVAIVAKPYAIDQLSQAIALAVRGSDNLSPEAGAAAGDGASGESD